MGTTSAPSDQDAQQQDADVDGLRSKWNVLRPHELSAECARVGNKYVIDGLIPERSLGLLVGDSGLGKSPLAYQMAICVAAGIPFLGRPTQQTRVLFLDFENGLHDVNSLVTSLSAHLGLAAPPDNLLLWNINDSKPGWFGLQAFDLIRDAKPGLVFMDPISAVYPKAEHDNIQATMFYQECRKAIRDTGAAIYNLHHRKKPLSPKPGQNVVLSSLEDEFSVRRWFTEARGPGVLVNGADIRLGLDSPGVAGATRSEVALVLRGYGRVRGEIPTIYLARVLDGDGEPLGYRRVTAVELLCNEDQEKAFAALPDKFTTKDATQAYGRQDEATNEFLKKCVEKGILRKVARGQWEKVQVAE